MPAGAGYLVLIKIGNGGSPETFATIGGLSISDMKLDNQVLNATNLESSVWKALLGGAGIASISITGSGIFTDSASEDTLRGYAFAGTINDYQFIFSNGDMLSGPFLIASYARSGSVTNPEIYSVALDSAGPIAFTPA